MFPRSRISAQISRIKQAERRAQENAQTESHQRRPPHKQMSLTQAQEKWGSWLRQRGWRPFPFQEQAWREFENGHSTLISVPTGSGKTYAAFGGPLVKLLTQSSTPGQALRIIYLSPLKALVRDIAHALAQPIDELELPFQIAVRTGDSSSRDRQQLNKNAPHILVTTPESLAVLLTAPDAPERFAKVFSVIVDEWHELLGTKRGSLLELTLAILKSHAPEARVTALSATLGNLDQAAQVITADKKPVIVRDAPSRQLQLSVLAPTYLTAAPWFGYAGLTMMDYMLAELSLSETQILFANTRAHAEAWYRELLERRPEWNEVLALHHGSLSLEERHRVENLVKSGQCKIIVATSSLELGVDFPQVGRVFQIGSVKSLARAVQRGGRGFHRPGENSHLTVCPIHTFEILEVAALRSALQEQVFEKREPLQKPLDVFVQFVLNLAYGEGFTRSDLRRLVDSTMSFKDITDAEIDWTLQFLVSGGESLVAYPQFKKLIQLGERYVFTDRKLAQEHRMNIGTIVSDDGIRVKYLRGSSLGTISEAFVAKLKKGDIFQFSGKNLEYVQLRNMDLYVRLSKAQASVATVWSGNVLPISPVVAQHLRRAVHRLAEAEDETELDTPELQRFWPVAKKQKLVSQIPLATQNLVELWTSREGHHLFFYPWAGRLVHEGLGHLLAFRLARYQANTISVAVNDHGLELLAAEPFPEAEKIRELFASSENLSADIEASLNFTELSKRSFREVARVSGLVQGNRRGYQKNQRHLQMSASLLYDVFERYEPGHLLVEQAKREVKTVQLHFEQLQKELQGFKEREWIFKTIKNLSPFAFPIYVERVRSRVSTESLKSRIERIQRQLVRE